MGLLRFLSACAEAISPSAFEQAEEHLRLKHGIDITRIPVPDDTSENNVSFIMAHLPTPKAQNQKYILVGHSKGVVDLQTALQYQTLKSATVALISVAGAVHGSPLADLPQGPGVLNKMEISLGCGGKIIGALQSLSPARRRNFL
jgi:triacylglycerol esterase/lipase EstA (alpha/beta hydrolase family)